jgi:hypothetical protein
MPHTSDCFLCYPPRTRCQRRMLVRRLKVGSLLVSLESTRELEDIYWEQVYKLQDQTIRGAFRVYARRFTKDRKKIEKALRSRGVAL